MTHEYTILLGGIVRPGPGIAPASAFAFAHDTILAVGSDPEVRAISRGDSRVVALGGCVVEPLAGSKLEPGAPASFRVTRDGVLVASVVDGRLEQGAWP